MPQLTDQDRDAIILSLYAGRKIEAIKLYRQATGAGLKDAKDFIESLQARLQKDSPEQFQQSAPAGCGASVVIIALLAALLAGAAGFLLIFG